MAVTAAAPPWVLPRYVFRAATAAIRGSAIGLSFRLMVGLTMAAVIWVVHTFLVVYANEGTWVDNPLLAQILVLRDARTLVTGTVFWTALAWMASRLVGMVLFRGPLVTLRGLVGVPRWVLDTARRGGATGALGLVFGVSGGLLAGTVLASRPLALALAVGGYLSLTAREGAVPLGLVRAAGVDLRRLIGRPGPVDVGPAALFLVGLAAGLLRSALVPVFAGWCGGALLPIVAIGLWLLLRLRGGPALAVLLLVALVTPALADDGGWAEAGGTLVGWITSPGSTVAVLVGLPPALGGGIGVLTGMGGATPIDVDGDGVPDWIDAVDPGDFVLAGGPGDHPHTGFDGGGAGCGAFGLPTHHVNLATLQLHVRDVVFRIDTVDGPLQLAISWTPGLPARDLGPGWRFSYDDRLVREARRDVVWLASGRAIVLVRGASDAGWRLTETADAIEVHDPLTWTTRRFHKKTGALLAVSQASRQAVTFERTGDALTAVVDPLGRRFPLERDAEGRLVAFSLPDGRRATFAYTDGRLTETADLAGVRVRYGYEGERLTTIAVGTRPRTWQFTWENGRIAAVTDPEGGVRRYDATAEGVRRVDEGGHAWLTEHDAGRIVREVDPLGQETRREYEGDRLKALHRPGRQTWTFEHDEAGRVREVTLPDGGTMRRERDADGRVLAQTLPGGATWRTTWTDGRPTEARSPLGAADTLTWDARGRLTGATLADGRRLSVEHDAHGNVARISDAKGTLAAWERDRDGLRVTAFVDALGGRTTYERDGNDRITRVVHPDGAEERVEWGCCAPVAFVDARGDRTEVAHDGNLRLTRYARKGGFALSFAHDPTGAGVSMGDALGRTVATRRDALGRPVDIDGVGYRWDARGRIAAIVDARGHETTFAHDAAGRLVQTTDPLGRHTRFERDGRGQVVARRDGRGREVRYQRDAEGRVVAREIDGSPVDRYAWDRAGRPVEGRNALGATRYQWGERLERIRYFDGSEATFAWDRGGRLVGAALPGVQLAWEHDARGRVVAVHIGDRVARLRRDKLGRVEHVARPNGTSTRQAWDHEHLVARVVHLRGEAPFIDLALTRDAGGRVTRLAGTVLRAPPPTASTKASYDAANQVTEHGGLTFEHDAAGNRVRRSDGWTAEYDADGRLVRVGDQRFDHDAFGRRVRIRRGSTVVHRHHDPFGRLLFETDAAGALRAAWVWAGDEPIARVEADGSTCWYHFDHLGHTAAVTDDRGEIRVAFAYDPFGNAAPVDPAWTDPLRWCGQHGVQDDGDGLYFMTTRHYDARTARFLQRDPIGVAGGLNLYEYAGSSPLLAVDPEGTAWWLIPAAVLLVFGGYYAATKAGLAQGSGSTFRAIDVVAQNAGDPNATAKAIQELGHDPLDAQRQALGPAIQLIDKGLGVTPAGPAIGIGKTLKAAADGNVGDAIKEGSKVVPGGHEAVGLIGDTIDLVNDKKDLQGMPGCPAGLRPQALPITHDVTVTW